MPQLEIDKWAQGKPPFLAIISQLMACSTEELYEILTYVKKQEPIPKLPEAAPKEWLRLYRNHRHLEKNLLNAFRQIGGVGAILAAFYSFLRARQKTQGATLDLEQRAKAEAELQKFYQLNLAFLESDLRDHPLDEETKSKVADLLITQEFLFLLKVFFPCQLLYGATPFILIRRARLGNLEALEQLISLDKLVLADRGIIRQTQRLLHHNKYKYESVVVSAVKVAPKFKLSRKAITYLLAGMLSIISEALGHRLEEPEIRALFNAAAHDRSNGKTVIHSDLPGSPETLAKAIQRTRSFWKSIFCPDKTF